MMTRIWRARGLLLLAGAGACLGCSSGSRREPARSMIAAAQGAADARTEGVRVFANSSGWAAGHVTLARVTPVQVRIENDGRRPLRVRYSGAFMVDARGQTYRAIPPFAARRESLPESTPLAPRFEQRNVALAPYLKTLYELDSEPWPMAYDYHDETYDHWRTVLRGRPPRLMREAALPEGSVRPGGELSGFLYFERVPQVLQEVTLGLELIDAETGERLDTVCVPLVVD